MAELDLIPLEYRRLRRLRRALRRMALCALVLVVSLGTARVALTHRLRAQSREIQQLEETRERLRLAQGALAELESERAELERRVAVLNGLRGGVAAKDMFVVVDRALDPNIWFSDWTFRRAGELVENRPEVVQTGYFVVVPREKPDEREKAWRMRTHMEIRGRAQSHATVARFVRDLSEQEEIENVRILSTQVRRYTSAEVVEFELAISVGGRP